MNYPNSLPDQYDRARWNLMVAQNDLREIEAKMREAYAAEQEGPDAEEDCRDLG